MPQTADPRHTTADPRHTTADARRTTADPRHTTADARRTTADTRRGATEERRTTALEALLQAVRASGGVARVSTLRREGHSRHYVRWAIETRALRRIRRDWVAVADANAELTSAARRGVVLSCVTQAARLGLWVLGGEGEHVAAGPHDRIAVTRATTVHWAIPVMPRDPDALVDPIENVLALVAACQPHDAALAVWESALQQGMIERPRLERLALPPAARRLLDEAQPYADSGLETIFTTRLKRLGLQQRSQIWIAGHHVDHLIGAMLVVQIDGNHHVGVQRTSDNEHDAALRLMGFTVIRVGYQQVVNDWPTVQWLIMQAVAQGLHRGPHAT
jgi:very-short-patch-repair endonuclease